MNEYDVVCRDALYAEGEKLLVYRKEVFADCLLPETCEDVNRSLFLAWQGNGKYSCQILHCESFIDKRTIFPMPTTSSPARTTLPVRTKMLLHNHEKLLEVYKQVKTGLS